MEDDEGRNILAAFEARLSGLLAIVALALESGMFSLWHVFVIGLFG